MWKKIRKKVMKKIGLFVMFLTMVCGFTRCSKNTINLVTEYKGMEIDLCDDSVREYLDEEDVNEQADIIYKYTASGCTYQSTVFKWESDGSVNYKVYFADHKDFTDAKVYETAYTSIYNEVILVPGKTYYWKVVGDIEGSTSKVDKFVTKDAPVRFIKTDVIANVRDIGGRKEMA